MEEKYIKLSDAKKAIEDYRSELTVSKYGSLEACMDAKFAVTGAMNELDYIPAADVVPRSEVDAIRKELARYIKRDILRRYSNDKIATAVVLQMSPESFLEKEAEEIVADVERKTLEKMREA